LFDAASAVGQGDPGSLYIENNLGDFDITKDRDLGYIHRVLDHNPCDILALGPLYKLIPRAIKTDDDAAPLLAALDSLRNRGCVIITEAHAGNERSTSLRPVGSSAFMRWPEFGHGLREDTVQPGRYFIDRWRGDRDVRPFPTALYRRGDQGNVPWVAEGVSDSLLARLNNHDALVTEGGQTIGF
jgi:replicative DNA helicase